MKGDGRDIHDRQIVAVSKSSLTALNPVPLRVSEHIDSVNSAPIILKSMARKAKMREEGDGSVIQDSLKKIITKSQHCGVRLGDDEATKFAEFVKEQ